MDRLSLRPLGDTGLSVSPLGLGTVKFGRNQGVKYPSAFELPSDDEARGILALARDLGINLLDTAPSYGSSEKRLGDLLAGQRKDWVIVGKVGEEFEDGESSYNFTPEHFEMSLERSLRRLNTDYIDVLLLHSDGNDVSNMSDDVIAKLLDFKQRGLVRAVGASSKTVDGGIKALAEMDVAMACYNSDYTDELPVLDYAAEHNKGVLLKKVMGSGHLPAAESLEFAFGHAGVSAAIVGTINPDHLRDNVAACLNALAE